MFIVAANEKEGKEGGGEFEGGGSQMLNLSVHCGNEGNKWARRRRRRW